MAEFADWSRAQPGEVIDRAVTVLRSGGRVAFPTDTCYEIGAFGLEEGAVSRLPVDGPVPLTLAVNSAEGMQDWVPEVGATGMRLARRCWPGPVTLIAEGKTDPDRVESLPAGTLDRLGYSLAFRCPAHSAVLEVARRLSGPLILASTSIASAGDSGNDFGEDMEFVIQDGPTYFKKPPTVVRVDGARWQVVSPGPVTEQDLEELLPIHILFVCTGNTCRSPLAEALCKKLLAEQLDCPVGALRKRGFVVESAGLSAYAGGEAARDAAVVAADYGADLFGHQSRFLTEDLLARADFLFGMTRSHLLMLASANIPGMPVPRLLSSTGEDIADPIGSDLETYRQCAQTIWKNLQELLPQFQDVAIMSSI